MEINAVTAILKAIYNFWPELYLHSIAVANLTLKMIFDLNEKDLHYKDIITGALLHDAGKIKIKKKILKKPGPLTPAEWSEIKQHPRHGAEWIKNEGGNPDVVAIVRYHHEWWNGQGYVGLKGQDIPFLARIVAIADALDAMTAPRPYRGAVKLSRAMAEIHMQAGLQFDSSVVSRLKEIDTYRPETYCHPEALAEQIQKERYWLQRLVDICDNMSHPLVIAQSCWLDKLIVASYRMRDGLGKESP